MRLALIVTILLSGCAKKFTDDQAENVARKCAERIHCKGRKATLTTLERGGRQEVASGLRRLPTAWEFPGTLQFNGQESPIKNDGDHEYCSNSFDANVSFEEHNLTRLSDDPVVAVRIPYPAIPNPERHPMLLHGLKTVGMIHAQMLCFYFLASGNNAEK